MLDGNWDVGGKTTHDKLVLDQWKEMRTHVENKATTRVERWKESEPLSLAVVSKEDYGSYEKVNCGRP